MILVIGYGSLLRGDDGIGQRAASILQEYYKEPEITILPCEQLTPELMEPISQADLAVFIDASINIAPGVIAHEELKPAASSNGFTHTLGPAALLEGAQSLYGKSAAGSLFSVGAESFALGESFSPAVEAALPGLLELVKERISA
jgi:hydrogenase maturation protease